MLAARKRRPTIDTCGARSTGRGTHTRAKRRCETVRKAGARPGLSKHRKCLLTCAGHNATLVPHTCCSGRHGGDTGPKRNGVRLVGVLCIILAFVLSWVMIICCFARWRGEGRFAKQTKEAPLAVVGKVFDLEQPVSTKSFVFSEDTLTSVDEPPEASLVYADAPAVEVVVKTATARPLRGFGDGPA